MNSFDHPLGEAHYETYVPEDVGPAMDVAEPAAVARLDLVTGSPEPLVAFSDATAGYDFIVAVADDLAAVLGGAWLEASRTANERAARFRTAVYQRRDLYEAIRTVEPAGPVEQRLRADLLRRFEHGGAHLDPAVRDRLTAINARLAELAADFITNLNAADAASGVATNDPAGLPGRARRVGSRGRDDPRASTGSTCRTPTRTPRSCCAEAENRGLREAMYRLTIARAAESNGPVVSEILALRQELAELLGYPDFVRLQSAGRMVTDPQAFLDELARAYRPQADREHAELLAFARTYTGDETLELTAADVDVQRDGFYATKLRESRSLASAQAVSRAA